MTRSDQDDAAAKIDAIKANNNPAWKAGATQISEPDALAEAVRRGMVKAHILARMSHLPGGSACWAVDGKRIGYRGQCVAFIVAGAQ